MDTCQPGNDNIIAESDSITTASIHEGDMAAMPVHRWFFPRSRERANDYNISSPIAEKLKTANLGFPRRL
jgi:hypothetical protein